MKVVGGEIAEVKRPSAEQEIRGYEVASKSQFILSENRMSGSWADKLADFVLERIDYTGGIFFSVEMKRTAMIDQTQTIENVLAAGRETIKAIETIQSTIEKCWNELEGNYQKLRTYSTSMADNGRRGCAVAPSPSEPSSISVSDTIAEARSELRELCNETLAKARAEYADIEKAEPFIANSLRPMMRVLNAANMSVNLARRIKVTNPNRKTGLGRELRRYLKDIYTMFDQVKVVPNGFNAVAFKSDAISCKNMFITSKGF